MHTRCAFENNLQDQEYLHKLNIPTDSTKNLTSRNKTDSAHHTMRAFENNLQDQEYLHKLNIPTDSSKKFTARDCLKKRPIVKYILAGSSARRYFSPVTSAEKQIVHSHAPAKTCKNKKTNKFEGTLPQKRKGL